MLLARVLGGFCDGACGEALSLAPGERGSWRTRSLTEGIWPIQATLVYQIERQVCLLERHLQLSSYKCLPQEKDKVRIQRKR